MGTQTRFTRLRRILAGAVALTGLATGVAVVGSSSPTSAAIQPNNYVTRSTDLVPNAQGVAGNYLACPTNHRVVSGGAFWHQAGQGVNPALNNQAWLESSTATFDGKGWYAAGFASPSGFPNARLTVSVQCLPDSQVGAAYVLRTTTLAPGPDSSGWTGNWLACPAGHRVVSGGAFWHLANQSPDPTRARDAWLTSSTATYDGKGWYAAGWVSRLKWPTARLTVSVQCLPDAMVGGVYVTRTAQLIPDAQRKTHHWLACPRNYRAVTGGSFWHTLGETANAGRAFGSWTTGLTATSDGRGFYASGYNAFPDTMPNARLTMIVQCLYSGPVIAPVDDYPYRTNPICNLSAGQCGTDPWGMTKQQCVSFVAWRLFQQGITINGTYGDAGNWDNVAAGRGQIVDTTPAIGAVAHWNPYEKSEGAWGWIQAGAKGHVAYVTAVNADGTVNLEEYNQNGDQSYHQRFSVKAPRYIHF